MSKMLKRTKILVSVFMMSASLSATRLWAGDLEWSGLYRFEGLAVDGPSLDSGTAKTKDYGLHTLILRPKIVAADGLYINAQLNIFNADYPGSQMGAFFGGDLGTGSSQTLSESQKSEDIQVSQFYLTNVQEYGQLIVGRAPVQFGLGVTHNAGEGLFDHFSDTRDLVGYKIMMGNFSFLPMYAKIAEGDLSGYDDIKEVNIQLQYENPESDAAMGVFYQNRTASQGGNDTPLTVTEASGTIVDGQFEAKNFNIFYKKETSTYNVGVELAQQDGETGLRNSAGEEIALSGFGVAFEWDYRPAGRKLSYGLKGGYASGDNPSTTDEFEGFIFDRNYDVAMLLFNHALGGADVLHTSLAGRTDASVDDAPDIEAISNTTYLSPYIRYQYGERWSFLASVTAAWVDDNSVLVGATSFSADRSLGYEIDAALVYEISDKISWINQVGYLATGDAFKAGDAGLGTDSLLGFATKAAVSF